MTARSKISLEQMHKLPLWFRQDILSAEIKDKLKSLSDFEINTVCQHAHCPNITTCLKNGEVTFMILGSVCTRSCRFCAVEKSRAFALAVDNDEPNRISKAVKTLGLKYVVITSVTRDDLVDGGAGQFVKTIDAIRSTNKDISIELLIPDFKANTDSIKKIVQVAPVIIGHNLETVEKLYPELKLESNYRISLSVLKKIKEINCGIITKSSLMLGLGEERDDTLKAFQDLRSVGCDILVLGQYLAPSSQHYPVKEFISTEQFDEYKNIALGLGFKAVLSNPLARSSYRAEEIYEEVHCA